MANIMRLGGGAAGGKPKKLLSSLTEGSLVSVLEDGKLTPFYVAKHNYEADLNGEGRTLLVRQYCHSNRAWGGGTNTYPTSDIDAWLNGTYRDMLSATVQIYSGSTMFKYTVGNKNSTVSNLSRSVFLLSATEFGVSVAAANVEGSALPIASAIIDTDAGVSSIQWTRSPSKGASTGAIYVSSGDSNVGGQTTALAIRPAFTLPATMELYEEPAPNGTFVFKDELMLDTKTATTTAKAGVNYTNGIADLDAATLHEIAMAISANPNIDKYMGTIYYDKGDVHRKISTGDTQNIDINGTSYAVNIVGFNHDNLSIGNVYGSPTATGKAGITFQLKDCYATGYKMEATNTNANGWNGCYARNTLMQQLFGWLSSELKDIIKKVDKLTSTGNKGTTIATTKDDLFLLSEVEIYGKAQYSAAGEGEQYAYYKAGNSPVKKKSGAAAWWWERSPYISSATTFCEVQDRGQNGWGGGGASTINGIAFAYCI